MLIRNLPKGNFLSATKKLNFREHGKTTLGQTPLTGLVVTCNEARRLADCLKSLRFCNERIVIDLESEDESAKIAEIEGVRVLLHRRVPIVEQVRPHGISLAKNDWVIFVDPDEVIPEALSEHIARIIASESDIGMIWLSAQFYFRSQPLRTGFWGTIDTKPMVFQRNRVLFPPRVHRGFALIPPYGEVRLDKEEAGVVAHFWADSYRQLFEKHRRYIRHEGKSLYETGKRFAWGATVRELVATLRRDLFALNGLRGGWTGIFLSFFHGWYVLGSQMSLRQYQRTQT